jgi:hypothetical protein
MRRWAWVRAGLLLLAVAVVLAGGLAWVVKREPDFYTQAAAVGPQASDPAVASDTQTRIGELITFLTVDYAGGGDWESTFTADELNAFLREDEDHVMLLRPKWEGFTDPRVSVQGDRLLVGGRVGRGLFSAVVSVEVRAWLVKDEPNTFAVELVSVKAGSLPWFKRWLMDRMSAFAVKHQAELTWYRGAANPVAVCRLKANQDQPDLTLTAVTIADGRLTIGGRGLIGP